jgi:hypothetical protein
LIRNSVREGKGRKANGFLIATAGDPHIGPALEDALRAQSMRLPFNVPLNDFTNAFKAYRRETIEGCRPFLSPHFNLTIELLLKTIVRSYSWTVIPITWRNGRVGISKLKIREMGGRYLFIALYCWLEKYFSQGDYRARIEARVPERATADPGLSDQRPGPT